MAGLDPATQQARIPAPMSLLARQMAGSQTSHRRRTIGWD